MKKNLIFTTYENNLPTYENNLPTYELSVFIFLFVFTFVLKHYLLTIKNFYYEKESTFYNSIHYNFTFFYQ